MSSHIHIWHIHKYNLSSIGTYILIFISLLLSIIVGSIVILGILLLLNRSLLHFVIFLWNLLILIIIFIFLVNFSIFIFVFWNLWHHSIIWRDTLFQLLFLLLVQLILLFLILHFQILLIVQIILRN